MKCHDCNGSGGVGHYSTDRDVFGREFKVAGSDKFFPCHTCHGSGEVTADKYSQSVLAEEERQRAFDNEAEWVDAMVDRDFRNDERYYN